MSGRLIPESWDLLLSVEFIAIVLIGGAGTVAGTLLGTFFVVMTPRVVEDFTLWLADQAETGGAFSSIADVFVATGAGRLRLRVDRGGRAWIDDLSAQHRAVWCPDHRVPDRRAAWAYGIWIRIRNYWKGWPFTY